MTTKEARARLIDVLRGSSALAVALFHFNRPYAALADPYHGILKWGWLGVSVFFVISGYCIAAARAKDDVVTFWFRRLLRIYPAYWASLLVVLAVVGVRLVTFGLNDVTFLPKSPGAWFYSITALTSPASGVPGMNWAYWSLGYELAFYILMGVLFFRRSPIPIIAFSILALLLSPFGYPFNQWGLFGLGVACYLYVEGQIKSALTLAAVCVVHLTIACSFQETIAGLLTAILIASPSSLISARLFEPLRRVGLFSYSLYLTHVPIGCYLLPHYVTGVFTRSLLPSIAQDALLLLGCLVFSYSLYRVVEKPTHEFARRFRKPTSNLITG